MRTNILKRGYYDIAHSRRDPFPGEFHTEWLNNGTVHEAIGVRTNWTQTSTTVYTNFKESPYNIAYIYPHVYLMNLS